MNSFQDNGDLIGLGDFLVEISFIMLNISMITGTELQILLYEMIVIETRKIDMNDKWI